MAWLQLLEAPVARNPPVQAVHMKADKDASPVVEKAEEMMHNNLLSYSAPHPLHSYHARHGLLNLNRSGLSFSKGVKMKALSMSRGGAGSQVHEVGAIHIHTNTKIVRAHS